MDEVLETLRPHLARLARPYADAAHPAESTSDLLQESCLRAWRKIGTFEGGENDEHTFNMFRVWMGQILQRIAVSAHRSRQRQRRSPPGKLISMSRASPGNSGTTHADLSIPAPRNNPSSIVRADERTIRVREALAKVEDATDAAILRGRLLDGKSHNELAGELDLTYDQVRERWRSCLRRLRKELGEIT